MIRKKKMTKLQEMFIKDSPESISEVDNIKVLSDEVLKMQTLEDDIENDEKKLKEKKEKLRQISGETIPTLMSEMSLTELKLMDGSKVLVKPFYGARITPETQEAAFNWLRENGLGDIIKNDVTVTFGRGEDNKAMAYATLAKGQGYEPVQKIGVHSSTLKAVVRERTESGQDMPADLFNTFVGNQTKITRRQ
jgi:hypothetical protein